MPTFSACTTSCCHLYQTKLLHLLLILFVGDTAAQFHPISCGSIDHTTCWVTCTKALNHIGNPLPAVSTRLHAIGTITATMRAMMRVIGMMQHIIGMILLCIGSI
jgi:hypothetical protein